MNTSLNTSVNSKNSSLKTEAIAGLTTFFTMAYIIAVNPLMLSHEGTGMAFSGVLTATVMLAFSMTLLMGLFAKLPFAVAPGMGINAFFTYTLVLGQNIPWQTALGIVFWSGVLFFLLSITPVRSTIVKAIPASLRIGAAVGIGIFLTFIGLKNSGIVVSDPVTFVKFGPLGVKVFLCVFGMVVALVLLHRKSAFAFLAAIATVTAISIGMGLVEFPRQVWSYPDFHSVAFKVDILGALDWKYFPAMISFVFTGLFDSVSSFIGVSQAGGLLDRNGQPKNLKQGLIVDSLATISAGLLGTSSGTAFVESSAGIEVGGRTGLTSVFTALCFLPFLFLAPLAGMVPSYATAPVLILVGSFMFRSISKLSFAKMEELFPAFLAIVLIPLSFSVTQGIVWGLVAHVLLYWIAGRSKEIHPILYVILSLWLGLVLLVSHA